MRIAKWAKKQGIKTIYYISPQIWAWRESRVHQIKATVDTMLCILPFEAAFYDRYDYAVEYVGHPLLDVISPEDFKKNNTLTAKPAPTVALLPGSRKQEIRAMLHLMLSVVPHFPNVQFVVAGAPSIDADFYTNIITTYNAAYNNVTLVTNETYDLLRRSDAAFVTSGTATLEVALFGVPEVVCYKGNPISFWLAKRLIKVKYISLVNLIMDRVVVNELIQNELTTDNLVAELYHLLDEKNADNWQAEYTELRQKLGNAGASERAAEVILKNI